MILTKAKLKSVDLSCELVGDAIACWVAKMEMEGFSQEQAVKKFGQICAENGLGNISMFIEDGPSVWNRW